MRRDSIKHVAILLIMLALATPAHAAPDTPEAFADWFIEQGFEGQELHVWNAVLASLIDGIDRSREAHLPIVEPVHVAILSGTKYHTTKSCSALKNAHNVLTMDVVEAKERGFEACGRCK